MTNDMLSTRSWTTFRRIPCLLMLAFVLPLHVHGAQQTKSDDGTVILRVSIDPQDEIWVGQRVLLSVDVLGSEGWAQARRIGEIRASDSHVMQLETTGTHLNETVGGTSYSGQRYTYSLFPQRGGNVSVPPVAVEVEVKSWGAQAQATTHSMDTPRIDFEVKVPPGAENMRGLITTTELRLTQEWVSELEGLKVGDALKRTITLTATDVSGMAFEPLKQPSIDGLRAYVEEPSVSDKSQRGTLTGTRTETVTYVFGRDGVIELPAIVIPWWDPDARKLNKAELPAIELEISPAPGVGDAAVGQVTDSTEPPRSIQRFVWALVIILLVLIVLWRFRRHILMRWQSWCKEKGESELAYFRRFMKAARSHDARNTMNALMRWLDRMHEGTSTARLDLFLSEFGSDVSRREANSLIESVTANSTPDWRGDKLVRAIAQARKKWLGDNRRRGTEERALPPLNP